MFTFLSSLKHRLSSSGHFHFAVHLRCNRLMNSAQSEHDSESRAVSQFHYEYILSYVFIYQDLNKYSLFWKSDQNKLKERANTELPDSLIIVVCG